MQVFWVSLVTVVCTAGFICFGVLIKYGLYGVYDVWGMTGVLVLGFGAAIGILPIGFLYDRQEALRRRRDGDRLF